MKKSFVLVMVILLLLFVCGCSKVDTAAPAAAQTSTPTISPIQTSATSSPTPEITPSPAPVVPSSPEPNAPSPTPTSVTETKLGFIQKAYSKDGNNYIDIDYIDMFFGEEAIAKALEDHSDWVEQDENGQYFIPNDYYIRNSNTKLRTFMVSSECAIQITDFESSGGISMKKASFDTFAKLVKKNGKNYFLMHVDVHNSVLVSMEEQYRP